MSSKPIGTVLEHPCPECGFVVHWEWIPREENKVADQLSVKALEEIGITRRKR